MSYARFSPESDVYVFLSVHGFFECCACGLETQPWPEDGFPRFFTTDSIISHLAAHRAAGHDVPDKCERRLLAEREENDAWIREQHEMNR